MTHFDLFKDYDFKRFCKNHNFCFNKNQQNTTTHQNLDENNTEDFAQNLTTSTNSDDESTEIVLSKEKTKLFSKITSKNQGFNYKIDQHKEIKNGEPGTSRLFKQNLTTNTNQTSGDSINSEITETKQPNDENELFTVITGKNGVGKSRLLQLIREYIVTNKNENYPHFIVRRLDYGEHDDDYDPDKTDHPLVTDFILNSELDFKYWFGYFIQKLKEDDKIKKIDKYFKKIDKDYYQNYENKLKIQNDETELKIYSIEFFSNFLGITLKESENFYDQNRLGTYYSDWKALFSIKQKYKILKQNANIFDRIFSNYYENQEIELSPKKEEDFDELDRKKFEIYFDEFKKYYRRQILKKICYGSLNQMLMLNMRYENDLDAINKLIDNNNYDLNFPYEIEKINKGFVDKSDLNGRIIFKKYVTENNEKICKKTVKFKELSPGEKLILHLIILIKDKENIKFEPDIGIKQILLLDEPDSHCEANLVGKFINVLKYELVNKMKIQVIMTSHNYLTISKEKNILVIYDDANNLTDNLTIKKDYQKNKSFEILANNMIDIFNLTDQPIEVCANAFLGVAQAYKNGSVYGSLLQSFFKRLTKNCQDKDKNLEECDPNLKKLLMNFLPVKDNINYKIEAIDIWDFKSLILKDFFEKQKTKHLLQKYTMFHIFWPDKQNEKAWDFMICEVDYSNINYRKEYISHLFQIKIDNYKYKETLTKHNEIIKKTDNPFKDYNIKTLNYICPISVNGHKKNNEINFKTLEMSIDNTPIGIKSTSTGKFLDYLIHYSINMGKHCKCSECSIDECVCKNNEKTCNSECHCKRPGNKC